MKKHNFIKVVEKPWGKEEWIVNKQYCGKFLTVLKNCRTSLHYHKNKRETFYVLKGRLILDDGKKSLVLQHGDIFDILPKQLHRVTALENSKLIEFSTHHEDSDSYRIIKGGRILKAIILCGGKGTRMKPLTYEMPKSLLPVHGKSILEHIFDLLKKYEIRDIVLAVGYLKEKIEDYVGDGSKFGLRVTYVEEKKPLGTAGPLALLRKKINETFIVSNGDELKDLSINEMLKQHQQNKALVTIALTEVDEPGSYGVAKLSGNKILEFIEKPERGSEPSNFVNAGFYIMEPEIFKYIPNGFAMLEKDVFPKIASLGKLYGYKFKGQWFDTGTLERYGKAIKGWKDIN